MDRPPPLDTERVRAFVIAGHGNLEAVTSMLAEEPALVNACMDWGGGDWETALGGASHTGSREIAELLLSKGARMDLFCAAALGKMAIFDAMLNDDPSLANARGPHGIPLIIHAMIAGQDEVVSKLESMGVVKPEMKPRG